MRSTKRKQSSVLASDSVSTSQRPRLARSQRTVRSRRVGKGPEGVFRRAVRWVQKFVTQSVTGRRR